MRINVTKTFLPPIEDYIEYLEKIWASGWITNNGELLLELEQRLAKYLGVPFVQIATNGTIALQLALRALDIVGEVITTPFSYVATINAILWENCTPIFVDIDKYTYCMDADKIEAAITRRTQAIMPVHVYGYPCNVNSIEQLALKYDLKVIYDGAHAFGSKLNGVSLLNYGDLSTLSFHATKLFHTVEGGAIIAHTSEMADKLWKLKSFGHHYDDYFYVGINGKNSEFHAAMGLTILPKVNDLISQRKGVFGWYEQFLENLDVSYRRPNEDLLYNYSYFPVLFHNEQQLQQVIAKLIEQDIYPRRYFYPALNTLNFVNGKSCPIAEDISSRILCLPFYAGLEISQVENICRIIENSC